jgi:hypothetical protein
VEYVRRPPGAKQADLLAVEETYAVSLSDELRNFWSQSDGPILWFGFKELQFFRLAEVLDDANSVRRHMPGAIPICMDGMGNLCVARVTGGEIIGYYVAPCGALAWDEAGFISETFWGLLKDDKAPERRLDA